MTGGPVLVNNNTTNNEFSWKGLEDISCLISRQSGFYCYEADISVHKYFVKVEKLSLLKKKMGTFLTRI